jgi:hypothetical protein
MWTRSSYSFSLLAHLTTDVPGPRGRDRNRVTAFAIVESIGDFHVTMSDSQKNENQPRRNGEREGFFWPFFASSMVDSPRRSRHTSCRVEIPIIAVREEK